MKQNLDSKLRELVLDMIKKCAPDVLVCHNVLDKKLGYYVQKARYGTENSKVPESFPDFQICYVSVLASHHGYMVVSVNEIEKGEL